MKKLLLGAAIAAVTAAAAPAYADNFNFAYTANGVTTSGVLTTSTTTTTVNGRQAYTITGITGTHGATAINQLYAAGTTVDGVGDVTDNYLFATGPYLTFDGFAYGIVGSTTLFNFYYNTSTYSEFQANSTTTPPTGINAFTASGVTVSRVAAAVPEAATWAMMILGMGMVGAAMRRRIRASEVRFDAKIKRIAEGAEA